MHRGAWVVLGLAAILIACGRPTLSEGSFAGGVPDAFGGDAYGGVDAGIDDAAIPDDGQGISTITISPDPILIIGPAGIEASASFTVTGTGMANHLASLQWQMIDAGYRTEMPFCPGNSLMPCLYGTAFPLPVMTGEVFCTPTLVGQIVDLTATADVNGVSHTVNVRCEVPDDGPSFVAPSLVGPLTAQVNGSQATSMTISNNGNVDIEITIDPGSINAGEWSIFDCVSPATCTVPQGGSTEVGLSFDPRVHGELDSSLTVRATSHTLPEQTVTLEGTGFGGVIQVNDPMSPAFTHDFGTIAKNQLVTHTVQLTNAGNQTISVDPSIPAAPFGITTAPLPISISGGLMGGIDVTCESASAMPEQTTTITLDTGLTAYASNTPALPATIDVKCTIANTSVQVTNPLDFGELRVGAPSGVIDVTITNPAGNVPVTIDGIALANAPAVVTLGAVTSGSLGPGASTMTTLTLTTAEVVDASAFASSELVVDITEQGQMQETLRLPVTGKVGAPKAVVLPSTLEFGTVCIGTGVMGEVTMTNTGTSTLKVQPPSMASGEFIPLFTNPTSYPAGGATLLPTNKAVAGVRPQVGSTPGSISSTMLWNVDVPTEFMIPITLELLDEGTAVSPARLTFAAASILDPPIMQQTVTLENCGPDAAFVSYDRVVAVAGKATAWIIDPPAQQRELLAQETMRVQVAFSPKEPGLFEANLELDIGGQQRNVLLVGEGTGALREQTSFYACDCSGSRGPGAWTGSLPLVALALVLRRSRRRGISARSRSGSS